MAEVLKRKALAAVKCQDKRDELRAEVDREKKRKKGEVWGKLNAELAAEEGGGPGFFDHSD